MYRGEKIYSFHHKIIKTDAGAHNLQQSIFWTAVCAPEMRAFHLAPDEFLDAVRLENALAEPYLSVCISAAARSECDLEFVTVTARPTYENSIRRLRDALPRGGT
jgi:hypothetical protein